LENEDVAIRDAERRARVLLAAGEMEQSAQAFESLITLAPNAPSGYVGLAEVAQSRKQWSKALDGWDECPRLFPDRDSRRWLRGKASALINLGRNGEAEAIAIALRKRDEEPLVLVLHATSVARQGRWDDALAIWSDLLDKFPDRVERP
jgi:cytochrome c-type biogenesis protein CcmH/NrfG